MAARRRSHNRTRKSRGRFRGLYRLLAVLLVLAAITAACVVFFRVQTILVEGANRYTEEEIILASGVDTGDYLAFLDIARITQKIRAELPYIEQVSIQRALPDTVKLVVEESVAAVAIQYQDQWWLMNGAGKLLEALDAQQAAQYPVLSGIELVSPIAGIGAMVVEEEQARWNCALELLAAIESRGELSRLSGLDCGSAGVFTLRYDGRYTLLLPTTISYEYITRDRFRHFFSLLDEALPQLEGEGQDLLDFTLWESTGRVYARHSTQTS